MCMDSLSNAGISLIRSHIRGLNWTIHEMGNLFFFLILLAFKLKTLRDYVV